MSTKIVVEVAEHLHVRAPSVDAGPWHEERVLVTLQSDTQVGVFDFSIREAKNLAKALQAAAELATSECAFLPVVQTIQPDNQP